MNRISVLWLSLFWVAGASAADDRDLNKLKLPPGFRISLYAEVPNARSMALGDNGTLFVGTRKDGRVFAVRDEDADGFAEQRYTLAKGLDMPNGIAFRKGALYVAESGRILRFDDIERHLTSPGFKVIATMPQYSHHGWRYIDFGPDGRLYVSMGAPCNICIPDEGLGGISRLKPDGKLEVYARGVRNSVGFTWHPLTKDLWFTDNGRDWLGDDLPPDELNHASRSGLHFGYPFCHGGDIVDPDYGGERNCAEFEPPAQELGPHVAALGLRFYDGKMFPAEYRHQLFIAEHGSWNRSRKIGYRISLVHFEQGKAVSYKPFLTGWLQPWDRVNGRPVDLLIMPDGSMLVSDDFRGRIYRITYGD